MITGIISFAGANPASVPIIVINTKQKQMPVTYDDIVRTEEL